jgi:hypothetical protein
MSAVDGQILNNGQTQDYFKQTRASHGRVTTRDRDSRSATSATSPRRSTTSSTSPLSSTARAWRWRPVAVSSSPTRACRTPSKCVGGSASHESSPCQLHPL